MTDTTHCPNCGNEGYDGYCEFCGFEDADANYGDDPPPQYPVENQ